MITTAMITTTATARKTTISAIFISHLLLYNPTAIQMKCAINAMIHATTHCQKTTPTAHLDPSSRLIDAIAATQGVYNKENTNIVAADTVEIAVSTPPPNRISIVDTTLSFAINPLISEVTIRQSPNQRGLIIGAIHPDIIAIRLLEESSTIFS